MKGLVDSNNFIIVYGYDIRFGTWEDEPDVQKWAIFREDGSVDFYALDDNFIVVEFDEIPDDYMYSKYIFTNGEFELNPNWVDPPLPTEARVEMLEADMEVMSDYSLELLYQISLLQLGMDESDVEE